MKIIIILALLIIIGVLGHALFSLLRNKANDTSTVKALTWRIALSILLFAGIIIGSYLGYLPINPPPWFSK